MLIYLSDIYSCKVYIRKRACVHTHVFMNKHNYLQMVINWSHYKSRKLNTHKWFVRRTWRKVNSVFLDDKLWILLILLNHKIMQSYVYAFLESLNFRYVVFHYFFFILACTSNQRWTNICGSLLSSVVTDNTLSITCQEIPPVTSVWNWKIKFLLMFSLFYKLLLSYFLNWNLKRLFQFTISYIF